MKKKDKVAFHEQNVEGLQKELHEVEQKITELMIHRYTKQVKNTREARTLRIKRAILRTILHQKELAHG